MLATLVNGHDVYRHSLLETPLPFTLPSHGPLARSIAIKEFRNNEITIHLDNDKDALLVLAEVWYPGWKAEVDGVIVDAVPVNYWMRGIPIKAGSDQKVRIYYREESLPMGAIISLLGIASLFPALRNRRNAEVNTN